MYVPTPHSHATPRHLTPSRTTQIPADLVDYKTLYETSPNKKNAWGWSSAFEQPALTETSESFLDFLGQNSVYWLPTELLARPNTGQLGLYRARVQAGQPAAPLVHINPLKDWEYVQELIIGPGCANFQPFRAYTRNRVRRPSGAKNKKRAHRRHPRPPKPQGWRLDLATAACATIAVAAISIATASVFKLVG